MQTDQTDYGMVEGQNQEAISARDERTWSRDVYGTIAFHNFAGIFGVIRALESSGNLASFETPVIPLLVMAVVTVALLVAAHTLWLGRSTTPARQPTRVR